MKIRYTAFMLALLMLVQVFAPEVARAKSSEPSKKTTVQLVKMGALDSKTYPKLDNKAILAIQKQARNNQNRFRTGRSGFFSAGSPYLPGQTPPDNEKAAAYGNLHVDFVAEGLKENGNTKPFQWKEIFGTDSNGKPGTANIYFVQRDAKTNKKIATFKLTVDKAGEYSLNEFNGKPAKLPLYSKALEPYKYDVELETGVSEKVTLLTVKLSETGDKKPSFQKDGDGNIVADIPLYLKIGQTASTKFISEWRTGVAKDARPPVNGEFNNKIDEYPGYFPFSKDDGGSIVIRNDFVNNSDYQDPGYTEYSSLSLLNVPEVKVTEGIEFADENDTVGKPTYHLNEANQTITTLDKKHKFKYDFTYDVIKGGKLTMTEVIPVTFDANGGKFASITEEGAEQKIVKEVDYEKDLTVEVEKPTKDRETFKGWATAKDGNPLSKEDFEKATKNIKEPKTFYAIWDDNDIVANELEVKESFKDKTGYVNDFIPSLDTLKGQVKIKDAKGNPQPLTKDDKLQILDDNGNPIADTDLKDKLYEKLKEDDATEVSRDVTLKAKVNLKNGTSKEVDIPIKVIKNIYEAKTEEGKPNYVPKDYVKVTVDPTTKAEKPQKYFYYVNPAAKVVIPGTDPTGTGDNKFVKWTMKADTATGDGAEYKLADKPRHMFTEASTITAQYVSDVIPANDDGSKPDTVPANFVEVKFVPTDKATDETKAEKIFWVNPEKEVTIPVKNPVGKQYFTFKEWKMGANADGAVYKPSEAKKFEQATTITATYTEAETIIPYDPKEPKTKPTGYVRVSFEADKGLSLSKVKHYYVKENAGVKLSDKGLVKPNVAADTGYKFEKWDKEDSLVVEAADIVVTAKATKLDNVIPEKKEDGTPNEKPKGYKEVTFVIKDDDKTKGSITGVAKFYVNPNEYVTINPPATEAKTGFEFGAWDKDATIPTVYKDNTTITGSFNGLKDVIPKTKDDDSEKPKGYVTVTFKLQGEGQQASFVKGETTVYYVDPNRKVSLQPPKYKLKTGWKFTEWDFDTTTEHQYSDDKTIYGNVRPIPAIIPEKDENNQKNPKPDGYVTVTFKQGDFGKFTNANDVKVFYVNPDAEQKLSDIKPKPSVTPDVGYKYLFWNKLNDPKIDEDLTVTALYQKSPDVVPKTKDDETEKPDGYITVKFSTEKNGKIKGTNKTEKIVYINPNKVVVLKDQAPEVTPNTGFTFADWDTSITKAIQYKDNDVIKAKYNPIGAVIPKISEDTKKPAGYVTVTFEKGTNGKLITGTTVYYVDPNKEVTVTAPAVTPNTGYKQKAGADAWDRALTQKFTADNTTITAQYEEIGDVIPQKNIDGSDKPTGYVTVKFKAVNGSLEGTTTYYVNGEKEVDLTNTANAITKNPNVGYKAEGSWDKSLKAKFNDGDELTFTFKALDDVIEVTPDATKPDGYVTVKLIPTGKATDETKAEKSYWVNPNKKNVTIPSTNPVGKKITDANNNTYTFTFKEWTSTIGVHGTWNPSTKITGTFTQDTDITAKYNVKAENLINAPIPKKDVVTPKGDVPEAKDLIKNIPGSENHPLPEGTKITYTDDGTPDVKNPGDSTAKVKIEYPNGKTVDVEVPITVVDNVVPQLGKDKPNVPDSYVKVTVDTTDKATDNTMFTKVFWVKPNVEVTIPDIKNPTGKAEKGADDVTRTYKFDKWQREGATPEKFYNNEIKDIFAEKTETTIVALYTQDENVKPIPSNGKWVPKGSTPSAKDFISNIYNDDDPNNPNNLPPGTKFEFTNGNPDTNTAGTNKPTKITVTYPNGEVETVDVTYNVTDDVVEQTDPNKKPDVPEDFVEVIVKTTEKATKDVTRTFWVNPNKIVTIDVPNPTGKDLNVMKYEFTGWNHPLRDQFTGKTIITAQYREVRYDPDVDPGLVETQIGKQPTKEDYAKQIKVPGGGSFTVLDIVDQPDVSSKGMKTAKVRIKITSGGKTKTKDVDVRVYVVPDPKIIEKPVPTPGGDQPNVGKGALNTTDHYQYLIGYPDGNFAPNKGMTRAEVATMFTRLLKERPVKWKHYNAGLSDIRPGDWYADTVGYAVQKGIVSGYPDGRFKPNKPITRAEFASIASRFDALAQGQAIAFSDLAPSHWGYRAIGSAASKGWISGYPDNTFRPEKAITRAEVTSVTNRMLNRYADLYWIDAHRAEIIRFGDVKRSDWYFEPIMEATMGHDFIRDRDGKTEHWTGVNGKSFI